MYTVVLLSLLLVAGLAAAIDWIIPDNPDSEKNRKGNSNA